MGEYDGNPALFWMMNVITWSFFTGQSLAEHMFNRRSFHATLISLSFFTIYMYTFFPLSYITKSAWEDMFLMAMICLNGVISHRCVRWQSASNLRDSTFSIGLEIAYIVVGTALYLYCGGVMCVLLPGCSGCIILQMWTLPALTLCLYFVCRKFFPDQVVGPGSPLSLLGAAVTLSLYTYYKWQHYSFTDHGWTLTCVCITWPVLWLLYHHNAPKQHFRSEEHTSEL
mgnify:CR=1 FL=1